MGYSLLTNSGTQMYGWDYSSQFIQFTYRYYDIWHYFFKTGKFTLYDPSTFLGTDNIGSNSYYGLFDPFVFITVLFPRELIPETYAFVTCLKGVAGALAMRAYLRYMKISETSARVGATAFAYCGFLNFMVGFPNVVSTCFTVPLILLGIEKIIQERKPSTLALSLALLGMISFFYLVVLCIFGVLYALWRYFWTMKSRSAKENWLTIVMGVLSFAVGLLLCAWTLLPSLRETSLSGRNSSVGAAYLSALLAAFKGFDIQTIFKMMFEFVGSSNARELMGLVSFFYPTCNYLWLPLMKGVEASYDAWTASLFCYTPMVIFFIYHFISNIRKKDFENIFGFLFCSYFVFTNFAYFFFFAFSGDGYGRWFIVLVPLIIREAAKGIDEIKESPKWQLPFASLLSVLLTILTFVITKNVLADKQTNPYGYGTYYSYNYLVPAESAGHSLLWLIIYQICLVVIESLVIYFLRHKDYLPRILIGFISLETIVCGNLSFAYGSSYSYEKYFNGGEKNAQLLLDATNYINAKDDSFFRVYQEGTEEKNAAMAFRYNGASTFHSLFNYDVTEFGRFTHIIYNDWSYGPVYDKTITSKSWSGYYGNKRADFDMMMGYKYYIIRNEEKYDESKNYLYQYNVPFSSKLIYQNERFLVYENPYFVSLGRALNDTIYQIEPDKESEANNASNFYNGMGSASGNYREIVKNEETFLKSAVFEENIEVPQGFLKSDAPTYFSSYQDISSSLHLDKYVTPSDYDFNPTDPGSFLNDSSLLVTLNRSKPITYGRVTDKIVFRKRDHGYLNDDPHGAYFLLGYSSDVWTRIYMIGDTFDEEGNLLKENALLTYEYYAIKNLSKSGSPTYNGLYGFYVPGKVKAIVYCRKKEGNKDNLETVRYPTLFKQEYSDFIKKYQVLEKDAFKDVTYSPDHFTFKTNYSKNRLCVTSLGYDSGWNVVATKVGESGSLIQEDCVTYKLDGGLLGLLAPEGEVTYSLTYFTPNLKIGVIFTYLGIFIYFGYEITLFFLLSKRKLKGISSAISKRKDD